MGLLVLAGVLLVLILCLAVWAKRRATHAWLLREGSRAPGRETRVSTAHAAASPLRKALQTVRVIDYTTADGVRRRLRPVGRASFDWGDGSGAAVVLYDGRRPDRADRSMVGFGSDPSRWHRVRNDKG